jgi:hypothetical protein
MKPKKWHVNYMNRSPMLEIIVCAAFLAFAPGCLIMRHSTNVIRKNEKPRIVKFESAQAKNVFDGKLAQAKSNKNNANPSVIAVPFLFCFSSTEIVSDNGIYNDQISICDTNGDDLITLEEATIYAAQAESHVATGEIQTLSSRPVNSFTTNQPVEYQPSIEHQQPPVNQQPSVNQPPNPAPFPPIDQSRSYSNP